MECGIWETRSYNRTSFPCACWPQTGRPWRSPSLPLQFHISEPPAVSSPESRQISAASASIYLSTKHSQSSASSARHQVTCKDITCMPELWIYSIKSALYCRTFSPKTAFFKNTTPYNWHVSSQAQFLQVVQGYVYLIDYTTIIAAAIVYNMYQAIGEWINCETLCTYCGLPELSPWSEWRWGSASVVARLQEVGPTETKIKKQVKPWCTKTLY